MRRRGGPHPNYWGHRGGRTTLPGLCLSTRHGGWRRGRGRFFCGQGSSSGCELFWREHSVFRNSPWATLEQGVGCQRGKGRGTGSQMGGEVPPGRARRKSKELSDVVRQGPSTVVVGAIQRGSGGRTFEADMLITHDGAQASSAGDVVVAFAGNHIRKGGHNAVEDAITESPARKFIRATDAGMDRGESEGGLKTAADQQLIGRRKRCPGAASNIISCQCPRNGRSNRLPGVSPAQGGREAGVWGAGSGSRRKQDPVQFI